MRAGNATARDEARLIQAADWLQRIDADDVSEQQLQSWLDWYGKSEANRTAFEDLQRLHQKLRDAPDDYRRALAGLGRATPTRKRSAWPLWATAAAVVLVISGALLGFNEHLIRWNVPVTLESRHATNRDVSLPDGSHMTLGGDTAVAVKYSTAQRLLDIGEGEAYFKVEHDATRPFTVLAGDVRITALGTAFNVQRGANRVSVSVTEGVVAVAEGNEPAVKVEAAHVLHIAQRPPSEEHAVTPPVVNAVDPSVAVAWTHGQLQFVNEPLSTVVESLNRYADREIVIGDPRVGELAYTGTVLPERADEWIAHLAEVFPVRTVPLKNGSVVLLAPP